MKLNDYLKVFRSLVKAWPQVIISEQEIPYERINTFAYINEAHEQDSDVMGKDERYRNDPHFFCRGWSGSGIGTKELRKVFPAMLCYEQDSMLNEAKCKESIILQFVIQDEYVRAYQPGTAQRSKEEIIQGIRDLRDNFIHAIFSMTHGNPAGYDYNFYPKEWLDENGFRLSGTKLRSLIQLQEIGAVTTRDAGGGVIECYFSLMLNTDMAKDAISWNYIQS